VQWPIGRLLLLVLVVLLGVQLTGLSCLDEWLSPPLHPSPGLSNQLQVGVASAGQLGDDGCPCHLAFMSVPKAAPESCYPNSLLDLGAPVTLVPGHTSPPFHPPLVL